VICQTADGEQAVLKATELRPDLVVMDIGLPGISGIEAARQILKASPQTRIVFLSQHDSSEMAAQAMKAGGLGYVTKIDAAAELVRAIHSVREGKPFLSQCIRAQRETVPTYKWQASYQAAVLETELTKMQERLQQAESEIHKRRLALSQGQRDTAEEREAPVDAMNGLQSLRKDITVWLERQQSG